MKPKSNINMFTMGARTLRQGGGALVLLENEKRTFRLLFSLINFSAKDTNGKQSRPDIEKCNFTQEFEKSGAFTAGTSFQLSSRRGGGKSYFFRRAKVTFPSKTYAIMTEKQKMRDIFKIIQMQRGKCPTCRPI